MLTWIQFAATRPDLADVGRRLFYQHGLGMGFLATTRPDGAPRVHPICPVLYGDGLYALIVRGPKLRDLRRDGRYALHSETCPPPRHDDAFYITGRVEERPDERLWRAIGDQMLEERNLDEPWPGFDEQVLFEFLVGTCLATMTLADDALPAGHTIWQCD